jgi:hypothetical protein
MTNIQLLRNLCENARYEIGVYTIEKAEKNLPYLKGAIYCSTIHSLTVMQYGNLGNDEQNSKLQT